MKKTVYQTAKKITKSLQSNVIYMTTENILKPVIGNRGRETGIQKKRVRLYVNLILANSFFADASIIIVNYFGEIIDGTHRYLACIELGLPVYFKLTADPRFNVTDKDILLDNIAIFNGSNPMWTGKEQQQSAVISGSPLAIVFEDLQAEIIADPNLGITSKDLTTNQMHTLLIKNVRLLHGKKRDRSDFKDEELTKIASSPMFYDEIKQVCDVIRYFKVGSIRPSKVLERLMPLVWRGDVNIVLFYSKLLQKGFQFGRNEQVSSKTIEAKILKLVGVKVSSK